MFYFADSITDLFFVLNDTLIEYNGMEFDFIDIIEDVFIEYAGDEDTLDSYNIGVIEDADIYQRFNGDAILLLDTMQQNVRNAGGIINSEANALITAIRITLNHVGDDIKRSG